MVLFDNIMETLSTKFHLFLSNKILFVTNNFKEKSRCLIQIIKII